MNIPLHGPASGQIMQAPGQGAPVSGWVKSAGSKPECSLKKPDVTVSVSSRVPVSF